MIDLAGRAHGCANDGGVGAAGMLPSWLDENRGAYTALGTAAVGLASLFAATETVQAQQSSGTTLPPVQVDAPSARRAPAATSRQAAPSRTVRAVTRQAPPPAAAPFNPTAPTVFDGTQSPNTLQAGTGMSRMPGTIQSTPQVVNVIPERIIREQNITTVDQALRNVPGVTTAIGEGGGGLNGDQFRIRGFDAKGDLYLDGLRDFGVYVRDSFFIDQVQVFKGPSSESFGMGTTGGAINLQSKTAKAGTFYAVDGLIGSGFWGRGTFDINQQINANQAFRIYGMVNEQKIEGRDHVRSDRQGLGASFVTGLQNDTQWTLNYLYQHNERTPEYGVPIIGLGNGLGTPTKANPGLPVTELGLPRSIFYGKSTDIDESNTHMLTSRLKSEINPWITVTNDTRLSYFDRYFSTSGPGCDAACALSYFGGGNPVMTYAGGSPTYDQDSWAIQNMTTAVAKFNTGFLRHQAVAGVDVFYAENNRQNYYVTGNKLGQQIRTPVFQATGYGYAPNPFNTRNSSGSDVGVFLGDRMWFTEQFSLLAGFRWDNYQVDHAQKISTGTPPVLAPNGSTVSNQSTSFITPRVSAIFEPVKNQTFYVTYSEAASPPGQFITSGPSTLNPLQPNLQPEMSKTYEGGFKLNSADGRLGFTAAGFQITKSNALFTDPTTGDLMATGEKQRVSGFEGGVTGQITDAWNMMLAYAYFDSEILTSTTLTNIGNQVQGVAHNNVSMWTTYNLSTLVNTGPGRLTAGLGVFYRDRAFTSSTNTLLVPYSLSVDAMLSYEWDKYRVALNGYNLTNQTNYDAFFNNRAIPNAGRTVTLAGSVRW